MVAGSINTLVYYSLYVLFISLDLDYQLSVVFATILGMIFSFQSFSSFVFKSRQDAAFIRFVAVYLFNIFFNIQLIDFLNWDNLFLSGLAACLIVAVFSFFANKYFVFGSRHG